MPEFAFGMVNTGRKSQCYLCTPGDHSLTLGAGYLQGGRENPLRFETALQRDFYVGYSSSSPPVPLGTCAGVILPLTCVQCHISCFEESAYSLPVPSPVSPSFYLAHS